MTHRPVSLFSCLLAVVGAGCQKQAPQLPPPGPVAVTWVTVQPQAIDLQSRSVAQTKANQRIEIRARVAGALLKQGFENGAKVEKGQLLFEIDRRPYEAALASATAQKAQAASKHEEAQRAVERKQRLLAADAAAKKELDDATTSLAAAKAGLDIAEAAVQKATLDLEYTRLLSPIAGRIGKATYDVGALVDAGANSLLAVVQELDPMSVTFRIPERNMLLWREGVAAGKYQVAGGDSGLEVRVETVDGVVHPEIGRVSFRGMEVDPATGTVEVNAKLPNPGEKLVPGQFVTAILSGVQQPGALVVPQRAVQIGAEGATVWIVDAEQKAQLRPVQVQQWRQDQWVVEGGLQAGDRVVTDGVQKLAPGRPVAAAAKAPSPDASK